MSWDKKFEKYGALKIAGNTVKVYKDFFNYVSVNLGEPVQGAIWSSHVLVVTLSSGQVRRYKDQDNHEEIKQIIF